MIVKLARFAVGPVARLLKVPEPPIDWAVVEATIVLTVLVFEAKVPVWVIPVLTNKPLLFTVRFPPILNKVYALKTPPEFIVKSFWINCGLYVKLTDLFVPDGPATIADAKGKRALPSHWFI